MSVQEDLQILRDARYGKDVRNALIDAIEDIDGVAQTAMSYAAGARDSAQSYANEAKAWADGEGAGASDPQYHNNAKYYSEEADRLGQLQADQSEAWATGKIDGTDVPSTATQYHNNAKYFSEEAERLGAAQVALAADEVDQAEAWATGEIDGTDVPSSAPQYHNNAKYYSEQVQNESENAEAWAAGTRGGTAVPSTDPAYENNAAYYRDLANYWYLQAKAIAEGFAGALLPMGTIAFASLPALADVQVGAMYNISDSFTTTADFEEGAGHVIPLGANVYKDNNGKWDILAGSPVSGVKGDKEVNYRQGNVNITPANVGAVAYFNDTDYQPVNQLAYNPTTKKLGLKVNGADTVIPFNSGGELYINNVKQKASTKKTKLSVSPFFDNWNDFTQVSTLPYSATVSKVVILDGEVHLLGGANGPTSHYKWDGTNWTSVSTLPFHIKAAIVYGGEIHIFGSGATADDGAPHYKWNGTSWVSVSVLPSRYIAYATVYNGRIQVFVVPDIHYEWDGTNWNTLPTLPFTMGSYGSIAVVNDELHFLALSTKTGHYKWDGTNWTSVSTLPYSFTDGAAVVLNNEIHILGGGTSATKTNHYKWDGSHWFYVNQLTTNFGGCPAFVLNDEIYYCYSATLYKQSKEISLEMPSVTTLPSEVGGGIYARIVGRYPMAGSWRLDILYGTKHYEWDGTSSAPTSVSTLPYNFSGGAAVNNNDKYIHILGGTSSGTKTNHYKWDGTNWTSVSTLPYNFTNGSAVILNGEIHILGGTGGYTKHYKWDGTSWTSVSTLPISYFYDGAAVVLNNEIHIFSSFSHYKWDGTSWTLVSTLPKSLSGRQHAVCVHRERIFVDFGVGKGVYQFDGTSWLRCASSLVDQEFMVAYTDYTGTWPSGTAIEHLYSIGLGVTSYKCIIKTMPLRSSTNNSLKVDELETD